MLWGGPHDSKTIAVMEEKGNRVRKGGYQGPLLQQSHLEIQTLLTLVCPKLLLGGGKLAMSSKEESELCKENFLSSAPRMGTQLMFSWTKWENQTSLSRWTQRNIKTNTKLKVASFSKPSCSPNPVPFIRKATHRNGSELKAAPQLSRGHVAWFPGVKETHPRAKWGISSVAFNPGTGMELCQEHWQTWKPQMRRAATTTSRLPSTYSVKASVEKQDP